MRTCLSVWGGGVVEGFFLPLSDCVPVFLCACLSAYLHG